MSTQQTRWYLFILVVLCILSTTLLSFSEATARSDLLQPPVTPTETLTPTETPTAGNNTSIETSHIGFTDLINVQKQVLDTTQWIVTTVLAVLTVSGITSLALSSQSLNNTRKSKIQLENLQKNFKDLSQEWGAQIASITSELSNTQEHLAQRKEELENLSTALEDVKNMSSRVLRLDTLVENLQKNFKDLSQKWGAQITSITSELSNIQEHLGQRKEELEDISTALKDVKNMSSTVLRLDTLAEIETYALRLFSTDILASRLAKQKLIQYSLDDDPVVRRTCISVFGILSNYPTCFVDLELEPVKQRLLELAKDEERGVRLEAKLALRSFGVDYSDEDLCS